MIIAGTAMPAIRLIPTGAPTNVPSCHRSFFFRDHGFLPQNVQPDGLQEENYISEQIVIVIKCITCIFMLSQLVFITLKQITLEENCDPQRFGTWIVISVVSQGLKNLIYHCFKKWK